MSESRSRPEVVEASALKRGPIRHEVLSESFLVRVRLVHGNLGEAVGMRLAEFVENFKRDRDREPELRIWERVSLVISDLSRTRELTKADKRSITSLLLFASTGVPASELLGKAEELGVELRDAAAATARELGFG